MKRQRKLPTPTPAPDPAPSTPAGEIPKWIPRDPYRPIDPDATPVDFYEPSFVRGVLDKKPDLE
jgi:hypothetical protein